MWNMPSFHGFIWHLSQFESYALVSDDCTYMFAAFVAFLVLLLDISSRSSVILRRASVVTKLQCGRVI